MMTIAQRLWWDQAYSDHRIFVHLATQSFPDCHRLHYLQMTTEKLSKAYLWRSGQAPPKSHTGFVRFMRAILDREGDLDRTALIFGFGRQEDLDRWIHAVKPLAYSLQQLTPALAGDGPNTEYPWPHDAPTECPAAYQFDLWYRLTNTGQGQKLLNFIERAVIHFDQYA